MDMRELFERTLQGEGKFVFLPQKAIELLRSGKANCAIFDGRGRFSHYWADHPLLPLIEKIEDVETEIFQPHLTDPEAWRSLNAIFGIDRGHGYMAFSDRSVVEFLAASIRVYRFHKEGGIGGKSFYCPPIGQGEDQFSPSDAYRNYWQRKLRGWLVVVRRRYPAVEIQKSRRRVVDYVHKADPAEVIRTAKLLGIK